jgi:ketosteroid isomerase-like protein
VFDDVAIKATWFTLHAQELAAICFSTPEVIMRILLIFVSASMCSCCCSAQKKGSTNSCPSDEQTIRTIEHERWQAATPRHDVATTDRLLAKDFFYSDDTGAVMSRNQLLQMYKTPQVSRNDVEPAQDIRVVVQGDIALMNFTLLWSVTQSGISWSQTSRFTEVFGCREGQWKILAMHERLVPNATRAPSQPADTTLDEFVGKYVISQKGEKLEIKSFDGVTACSSGGARIRSTRSCRANMTHFLRAANQSWNFFCEIKMARSLEFFTRCRMENLKRRD